jgi:biotin synthase
MREQRPTFLVNLQGRSWLTSPWFAPHTSPMNIRTDWSRAEVEELFAKPFMDLIFQAQQVHRLYQVPNTVQISTLLSIKTGACPEDCAYCPQSIRYDTGLPSEELLEVEAVAARAHAAKAAGATRFCMGAAYRSPKPKDLRKVIAMIREVKSLGLETCATLGMVNEAQALELKAAGLDYYNHNLDTSPEYYEKIITTRTYRDRLDTLEAVRNARAFPSTNWCGSPALPWPIPQPWTPSISCVPSRWRAF